MPVSIARLRALIDLAAAGGVEGVDLIEDGTRIRITRSGAMPARITAAGIARPDAVIGTAPSPDIFPAPMFGVLHMTPAPDAAPFVAVGDRVSTGQQLCLIEAMKMFNAIVSDRAGRLEAILAEPGSEVASGQPLFRIVGD